MIALSIIFIYVYRAQTYTIFSQCAIYFLIFGHILMTLLAQHLKLADVLYKKPTAKIRQIIVRFKAACRNNVIYFHILSHKKMITGSAQIHHPF